MTMSSSQVGFASCCICALITGVAFLLEGCGDGDDETVGGDAGTCNFNMTEWRKDHEQCFHDLKSSQTCKGIEAQLTTCFNGAPRRAFWLHHPRFDKFPCSHEKFDWKWAEAIIDSKFTTAKTKFQANAEECLSKPENQPAKDCSDEAKKERYAKYDICWKPAEDAAGGTWDVKESEDGDDITTDCPMHWFFDMVVKTRTEWVDWYKCECKKDQTSCTR
jgi:hypothetical protein